MIWGITDGSAGMQSQVQGVLEELGLPYTLKTCRRRAPWKWLPVSCWHGALRQLTHESDALEAPWPAAVITSGRRSAALGLAVKDASSGATKAIHLTDPRGARDQFDLIAAMAHDEVAGANIISTELALHRITTPMLEQARAHWQPIFAHLPRPWIGVLLGGSTHRYTLDTAAMRQVIAMMKGVLRRESGSLLITPSRRTGAENTLLLREALSGENRAWLAGEGAENPYLGILACADYLVVSADSVNMLSEAAYTQKPLYILPLPNLSGKPARFSAMLLQRGFARELSEAPLAVFTYMPPDERARVAAAIRELL